MTWSELVATYAIVALLTAALAWPHFKSQSRRFARTLALGTAILVLGDIIAEQRDLWIIPQPAGPLLLGAPIENVLWAAASLSLSLSLYLLLRGRLRERTARRSMSATRLPPATGA